jgi:hypothetical protein
MKMISDYRSFIRLKQLLTNGLRISLAVICLLLILAVIAYLTNQINCTDCPFRSEYEGQVIDKSLTLSESRLGSSVRWRLLIQSKDGELFNVSVAESVYNKAQIGGWIKTDGERIEFLENISP